MPIWVKQVMQWKKVNFDFWQLIFGICAWNQKWWILTEWVRSHCSLIGPLKVVKNSQKVPIWVKKGYAMEKVTQISSRIIHLKIKKKIPPIHFGSLWTFMSLFEEARTSQKVPKWVRLPFCSTEKLKAYLGPLTVEPLQEFNFLDALDISLDSFKKVRPG